MISVTDASDKKQGGRSLLEVTTMSSSSSGGDEHNQQQQELLWKRNVNSDVQGTKSLLSEEDLMVSIDTTSLCPSPSTTQSTNNDEERIRQLTAMAEDAASINSRANGSTDNGVLDHVWVRSSMSLPPNSHHHLQQLLPSHSFNSTSISDSSSVVSSATHGSSSSRYHRQRHLSSTASVISTASSSASQQILRTILPLKSQPPPPPVDLDEQEDALMRILAGQLTREWCYRGMGTPALERRIRDFRFAQGKRRDKYGTHSTPVGVLGLYDHLVGIRLDLEWAEDAAWRRDNQEPYLSWVDFEITRKEGFNRPFFTYFLLLVCTVMVIVSIGTNGWTIEPLTVNPMIGPSADTLLRLGAKDTQLIVLHSQWYRIFVPMVLHAGIIHYCLNMLALWFVGSAVEQCHGTLAAAILFIIPAVGGLILSALLLPQFVSVGASGGIFGLVGACLADIVMNWTLLFSKHVNNSDKGKIIRHGWVLFWLFLDIVVNLLIGLTPYVDNFTHLGGMIYGFLCGLSTMERLSAGFFGKSDDHYLHVRNLFIRFLGIFVCVAAIMTTTVLLLESDGLHSPCPNCRYVSCLPFPPWKGPTEKWWYCDDCGSVAGDATKNVTSNIYDHLTLFCPNGEQPILDITDRAITNASLLSDSLAPYCRQFCLQ